MIAYGLADSSKLHADAFLEHGSYIQSTARLALPGRARMRFTGGAVELGLEGCIEVLQPETKQPV